MKRLAFAAVFVAAFFSGAQASTISAVQKAAKPVAEAPVPQGVAFGGNEGVIELKHLLKPFAPDAGAKPDGSSWYTFTASNDTDRPAIRVLQAGQPPGSGLDAFPRGSRPSILQIASANQKVIVERANAYGRHAYRLTIPPKSSTALALRLGNAQNPPSLLAWTEPAFAAHNRQLAMFVAAVAGLIAAAAAIAAGLSVMTHHVVPRWAATTLFLMLLTRLATTGMFDASLASQLGGPYGLTALFAGLTLAAGGKLVDAIVPLKELWPRARRWLNWALIAMVTLSVLAYLGVPAAILLTDIVLVGGTQAIFAYLIYRGRRGSKPARVVTPSAGLFALVSIAATFTAMGGFGSAPMAPDLAGGFAAAGAVLLALAVAAGEGIALLPLARHALQAPAHQENAPPLPPPPPVIAPIPHAAIEAIGASHQGVFQLDFTDDTVALSREAASLLGLAENAGHMPHATWLARVHPDDRGVYEQAVSDFKARAGQAFRIEFRADDEDRRTRWFELRATMKGPQNGPAERCVGLLADVTVRKETEAAAMDRTLRDPLTGLGNRVALMEELESLGDGFKQAIFALLDIDRFKTIHASLGDAGGDDILARLGRRLVKRFAGIAQVFRVGGDAFAVLLHGNQGKPADVGAALVEVCGAAHMQDGRNVFAPASVGVTEGREARDPIDLLKNAELALMQAKRQGGDCARIYSRELEVLAPADSVALETELRGALDKGEIEVFYQPIIWLSDRAVAGFEALLRWRHPTKGLIAPADFIAHSEETGLIVTLGRLALKRAAKDLAQWQRFFPLPQPLFVSVNLSRRQLRDDGLEPLLSELLSGADIAHGTLRLEITESAAATDADARALMVKMRALGAGFAIDDFGTGVSSLSQLRDLPFDTVKIDKSFLSRHGGTDNDSDGDIILSSIIALARDLKRSVIVEGVESEADAVRMAELGCECAQGFLFSEPLTATDALAYIARHYRAPANLAAASGAAGLGGQP